MVKAVDRVITTRAVYAFSFAIVTVYPEARVPLVTIAIAESELLIKPFAPLKKPLKFVMAGVTIAIDLVVGICIQIVFPSTFM